METQRTATQVVEDPVDLGFQEEQATHEALAKALSAMLARFPGVDPDVAKETPYRVIGALDDMTAGYAEDPEQILASAQFPAAGDDLVILKDVEFVSVCEHHLMPFMGVAHVGYLPEDYVVGISKLARLVDCFAHRLQLQERLCHEIAAALMRHLSSRGAGVVIEATHDCLACRGARKARATFITSAMLGAFRSNGDLRREFFSAIHLTHTRI